MAVTAFIACAWDGLLGAGPSFRGHLLSSLLVPRCLIAELKDRHSNTDLALDVP